MNLFQKSSIVFLVLITACKNQQKMMGEPTAVVQEGATPTLISRQFAFTEGPAVDKAGNVYFTDQPNNKIWKYDVNGNLSLFRENMGRANGLYIDRNDNIISCSDENNQIWSISPDGKTTVIVNDYNGKRLNGPNDVWVHPNGNMYFTDPLYKRNYWLQAPDVEGERVYFFNKKTNAVSLASSALKKPNGIIGTPDGKLLYVADIGDNKTYKFEIHPDGSLGEAQLFVQQGSDGMTIDNRGNIYLSGNGVTIYNPAGEKIAQVPVPEKWTANVCFAGPKKDKLFITASQGVYILPMNVNGVK